MGDTPAHAVKPEWGPVPAGLRHAAAMRRENADRLLAVARTLRLRRFMGALPFDVDAWMAKGLECDVPRLKAGETGYHFEVRDVDCTVGTSFELHADDQGRAWLRGGDPNRRGFYPADLDGWRTVVAQLNEMFPRRSEDVFSRRLYIWLHDTWGYGHQRAREAESQDYELRREVLRRLADET